MNLKLPKPSTVLFLNILIFLIITMVGYFIIFQNFQINNNKNQEIIFFQIKDKSSSLLTKILNEYHIKKDSIKSSHEDALKLFKKGLDVIDIKNILDEKNSSRYEVYILDSSFKIEDSSLFYDIGTNLSIARNGFLNYLKSNKIGVVIPEYSNEFLQFISYTVSKLDDGRYFTIIYFYDGFIEELKAIQELINGEDSLTSSIAYIISNDYVGNFAFKSVQSYKQTIMDLQQKFQKGGELLNTLGDKSFVTFEKIDEDKKFKVYNLVQTSPIYDDAKILYCIVFDEKVYFEKIFYLRVVSFLSFIIGTFAIYLIYSLRNTELLLSYKDKFIAHSIHEINTPLSIITINTQLREKLYGSDKYSLKINGALKTLENSYEDMTFLHTKDKIEYEIVENNLQRALESRVKYFDTIANSQNRKIELIVYNNLYLKMGKIELNRLIDNNISNAIKYSLVGSIIKIVLKGNILEFHSIGQKIENPKNIFKKYNRENRTTGGHGLGLAIVSDICKKYNFTIEVESKDVNIFRYIFNEY